MIFWMFEALGKVSVSAWQVVGKMADLQEWEAVLTVLFENLK